MKNLIETDTEVLEEVETLNKDEKTKSIILINDNHNTFPHVIECLMDYCEHSLLQAEQCAIIVHHNGKCAIKNGSMKELKPIKEALEDNGLTCEIQ